MPIAFITHIINLIFFILFVLVNFIGLFGKGTDFNRSNGRAYKAGFVVILLILFLFIWTLPNQNDCCGQSASFHQSFRSGIYITIFLHHAYTVNILRVEILAPVAELMLNVMLILGLILNVLFCIHFTTTEEGCFGLLETCPLLCFFLGYGRKSKVAWAMIDSNAFRFNARLGKNLFQHF